LQGSPNSLFVINYFNIQGHSTKINRIQ
jgi:hypothetical protein